MQDTAHLVAAPYVEKLKAHRLTFTLPLINAARNVAFLVAGKNKREILARVLEDADGEKVPAQLVKPTKGKLYFFADEAAAGK